MNELDFARNEIAKLHDDIHELTAERDALRAELSKQQALTEASQRVAEVAQYRADTLRARVDEMEKQEPICTVINDYNEDGLSSRISEYLRQGIDIYLISGARPAPSAPDAVLRKAICTAWYKQGLDILGANISEFMEAVNLAASNEASHD